MIRIVFGAYQEPKVGNMRSLDVLVTLKTLGGFDVSSHVWGSPIEVEFEDAADGLAAADLVKEIFEHVRVEQHP